MEDKIPKYVIFQSMCKSVEVLEKISAEESQRKMSRAYVRFKKAFGNPKEFCKR